MKPEQDEVLRSIYRSIQEDARKTCPQLLPVFTQECEKFERLMKDTMTPSLQIIAFLFFLAGSKHGLSEAKESIDSALRP